VSRSEEAAVAWEPRHPALVAGAVFALAAASLCWPMALGYFLAGDDQYLAGYGFRLFGAQEFRATGTIPQWNPYLFGGLPFIAAQHGDIFYPTAWLRWVLPVDTAMNLGFAVHLVIAGATTYALLRALGVGWGGAVVGGLAYELTGIVASLVKPGHDGKLFVSALAPLALLALLRAVRDRQPSGYGLLALVVGLCLLSPHYQMTYYLLVAAALWTLYLAFLDRGAPPRPRAALAVGLALGAVLLGLAIAAIQILPFLAYIPNSPRAAGGPSGGWEYATAFSMPPEEIVTAVLPEFNGVLESYWGRNFFKLHTEYLGAAVVALAALGLADRSRRRVAAALGVIAGLFLLVSWGGHTPFYRAWYEVMPMMKKVRAPGMAFFLVALPVAAWAGFGADRLLRRQAGGRTLWVVLAALAGLGLLGAVGVLGGVGTLLADPEQGQRVAVNAGGLRLGALRLLVAVAVATLAFRATAAGTLRGPAAVAALALVVGGDLWSVVRRFFDFHEPAASLYRDDAITARLAEEPTPFRVLDAGVYRGSYLMAHRVQTMLGYHGNEVRWYDELLGGKGVWANAGSPALLDLLAVRFLLLPAEQPVPGYRRILGPAPTTPGGSGVLFERDSATRYVRFVPSAVKVPAEQVVATVADPRFPVNAIALFPDSAAVEAVPAGQPLPAPSAVQPALAEWAPGRMRVTFERGAPGVGFLVVGETWYPDWRAEVDGRRSEVLRANHALIGVRLPEGAREVRLWFSSDEYARGRLVTVIALAITAGLGLLPAFTRFRNRRG
jgi:hypothetical protein